MKRLFHRLQTYYQHQKIAGKLNLVLLLLLSLVLANSAIVFVSLCVAHGNNKSVEMLDTFEKQIDEIRLAQWRFRVTHDRTEALAAKDLLDDAQTTLGRLPPDVFGTIAMVDKNINVLMSTFTDCSRDYLYYYAQMAALESGLHQASNDLLNSLHALQAKADTVPLQPMLASLVQSILSARLAQQEFIIDRVLNPDTRMDERVETIVAIATQLRERTANIDLQIAAYHLVQQARRMGAAFGKLRDYAFRNLANEERMNTAATQLSDLVGKASQRQREAIDQQAILIISSIVVAALLIILVGSRLRRRFVRDITSPLTHLVRVSGKIAQGDYDHQIDVTTSDETGELAASFNDMANTIKRHVDTLSAREQEVRQRTTELEISNRLLALAMEATEAQNESLETKVRMRTSELEDANRKLSDLTVTDALTGLANRRRFDAVFADEWSRACRSGQSLAIIMLDIDFFKLYNDHYGHPAGDDCLRAVAQVLQTSARRAGDLVARYGGEEFVVVAADSDRETALELAETMRRSVELLAMPHDVSPASNVVTVSLGVAAIVPSENMPAARLLHLADDALYRAKRQGRNRIAT